MLEKLPIEKALKRDIEDHIVFQTYDSAVSQVTQSFRRYLFYGYSLELMKETTKTIACQNNWLFHQIDSSILLSKFLHGEESSLTNIFEMAKFESQKQNSPFVFMINEIDQIFGKANESLLFKQDLDLLNKIRIWLLNSFAKIETPNFENYFKNKGHDFIIIFNTRHPTLIDEGFIQRLAQKSFFFDFQNLKQFKLAIALRILDIDYKINSFSNFQDRVNGENSKYNEKYMSTYSHNYDYNSPNYNSRSEHYFDKFQKQRLMERKRVRDSDASLYRPENVNFPNKRLDLDIENFNKKLQNNQNSESNKFSESQKSFYLGGNRDQKGMFANIGNSGAKPSELPYKSFNPQDAGTLPFDQGNIKREISPLNPPFPNPEPSTNTISPQNQRSIDDNTFTMGGSDFAMRNSQYDFLRGKMKNVKFSSFLQYYDDYWNSRYDDNYYHNRGYDDNYGNNNFREKDLSHTCIFPNTEEMEIIKKDSLEFGISRRPDEVSNEKDHEEYAELFNTDNILFIRGKTVCIKFDNDFEDFIKDHCLAWKYNDAEGENLYYNRAGFIFEDSKTIVRLTLNKFLNSKATANETTQNEKEFDYFNHFQDEGYYGSHYDDNRKSEFERKWIDNEFIFTSSSLKISLLNYIPITTLEEANAILKWSSMHQYIKAHLQYLTSKLSEAFLVPQKDRLRMMQKRKYDYSELQSNGAWNSDSENQVQRDALRSDFSLPIPEKEIKSESLSNKLSILDSQISSKQNSDSFQLQNEQDDTSIYLDSKKLFSLLSIMKRNMRQKEKLRYWTKLQRIKSDLQQIRSISHVEPSNKLAIISKLAGVERTLKEIQTLTDSTELTEPKESVTRDLKDALDEVESLPMKENRSGFQSSQNPFQRQMPILIPTNIPSQTISQIQFPNHY